MRPGSPAAPFALAVAVLLGGACGKHEAESVIPMADAAIADAATSDAALSDAALSDARADTGSPCVPGGTTALVPTIVACGPGMPMRLAVDGVNLYWTDRRAGAVVYKAPLVGGAPTVLLYDDAPAEGLALGNTYVYFTQPTKSRVVRVPKAGGAARVLAAGLDTPSFLALDFASDGPTLYWTGGQRQGEGKITRMSLAVGSLPETLVDGQSQPRGLAVSSGFVYWTDGVDGTVLRAPDHLDPAAETRVVTRLASGLKLPSDLVLVDGYAYVPDLAGRIVRVPMDGGALETVAKVPGFPFGIATDGLAVYWTTTGKGGVFKAPLGANVRPTTIIEGESEARFLVAAPNDVYWGAWGEGGTVRRMAKLGRPSN
jgi:hypothetical protein